MSNLQDDGWDLSDLKYIKLTERELENYRLEQGDILFNRTNSKELVGKCEVFREVGDWVFASYLIRVRTDEARLLPQFVSDFLGTAIGRLQIDRFSRQIIGMTTINAEEIRELQIPVPPVGQQKKLVAAMDKARAKRGKKLADTDALLAGMDAFLLDAVGLTPPPRPRGVFAVQMTHLRGALNVDRYRGLQLEKGLAFSTSVGSSSTIVDVRCTPRNEAPDDYWDWVRIDDLPNQPWQIEGVRTELGKNITGSFFEVQENDILIARLGPTILNAKFVLCPKTVRRTVASAEFLVLRPSVGYQPEAILWLLRTALYREIMYLRSRGATPSRFRLDASDLLSIPFPKIGSKIQTAITTEVRRCHREAHRLRAEANEGWEAAKLWFEEQLLGEVP